MNGEPVLPPLVEPPGGARAATELHLHFPIEVVVVGELDEQERQAIEDRVWAKLDAALG